MPTYPGGTYPILAYRLGYFCLRLTLEYRLPLIPITRLVLDFTLSHYGSCAPLPTLSLNSHEFKPKAGYWLLARLCQVTDLHRGYTICAELAHKVLRVLKVLRGSE